jgi:glycosyltransferase involved in cell wall biosynthesis
MGVKGRYVLYVGGFERRKNVPFLVEAFLAADLDGVKLVLAGNAPSPTSDLQKQVIAAGDRVIFTGFVADPNLAALYRRALVFVYPSLYEGFGLQLCEAMSFGCPVLASSATSLPEVLGTGGETFSPLEIAGLRALLRRVANDSEFRAQLVTRAERRATDFSWQRTAQLTYDVYRSSL